jgi:myo-inositol-1(or 4)-monophosphatase
MKKNKGSTEHLVWHGREPKAAVDDELNAAILSQLEHTGLPILSEETGGAGWPPSGSLWIVDPLDGTINYTRGLGPSGICICLWDRSGADFGAILDVRSGDIAWGGKAYGAWRGERLQVSSVSQFSHAVLCTGFPAAFEFDGAILRHWSHFVGQFAKVRMLGSAASSLLLVAAGAADCYYEEEIRIWDVAAGLALVEGAGGAVNLVPGRHETTVRLLASNNALATRLRELQGNMEEKRDRRD